MEGQQLVDYIRDQIKAGHSEQVLRQHLVAYGWSASAVNDAFAAFTTRQNKQGSKDGRPPVRPLAQLRRRVKHGKWTRAHVLKMSGMLVVGAVLVTGWLAYTNHTHNKLPPVTIHQYSYQEKQGIDVNNVAGAIALYAQANGVVPTGFSTAADGNLVLCGTTCDALTNEVTSLMAYKPAGIKLVPYATGLSVNDKQTMYVVAGGSCTGPNKTLDQGKTSRSMAILYARASGSQLMPRCVTL